MSIFDRLEQTLSRTIDGTFANEFTCSPALRSPNGRPVADPDRASWTGKGIFEENDVYQAVEIGKRERSGNDLHTLATGHTFELSVDRVSYPMADEAKQADRITMSGDLRSFEVISVRRDGMSRVVFQLAEIR